MMVAEPASAIVALMLLPLVFADHRSLSVPTIWLGGFVATTLGVSFIFSPADLAFHLWGASAVLVGGGLIHLLVSGRLGEADIVTASALALVSGFYDFLASMMLACLGAFLTLVWITLRSRSSYDVPVPFLPSLAWGWISIQLANGNLLG